jgi:hypothetical protein
MAPTRRIASLAAVLPVLLITGNASAEEAPQDWRLISFGDEDGSGRNDQRHDVAEPGPLLGVGISF